MFLYYDSENSSAVCYCFIVSFFVTLSVMKSRLSVVAVLSVTTLGSPSVRGNMKDTRLIRALYFKSYTKYCTKCINDHCQSYVLSEQEMLENVRNL